jgi:hypothetical protein
VKYGPVGWENEQGYQQGPKTAVKEEQKDWPDSTECPCMLLPEGTEFEETWHDTKAFKREVLTEQRE